MRKMGFLAAAFVRSARRNSISTRDQCLVEATMKFNRRISTFALGFLLLSSSQSFSQDVPKNVVIAAQVCAANACGDIDPATGLIIMALAQIAVE